MAKRIQIDHPVVFPQVHLRDGDYIEEFKLRIKGGRISAIPRIPNGWDITVLRVDGNSVVVHGRAVHFSAGLSRADCLNGSIAVESEATPQMQAVLRTESTEAG